jgi:hypothetical protein
MYVTSIAMIILFDTVNMNLGAKLDCFSLCANTL